MTASVVRNAYRAAIGAWVLAALPFRGSPDNISVFYGGARPGDLGGTLVKVRLLHTRFPEHRRAFSLFYLLSNALYVPHRVLGAVKAKGLPIVLNQNGVFYPGWHSTGWERENARMAKVHALADHVFYQSEFCRRCAERFLGARPARSEILYNGVNTDAFTPHAKDRSCGPFRFLVTGKIGASTAYRLTSSLDGLAMARKGGLDVAMTIAGYVEPQVLSAAQARAAALGIAKSIRFLGAYNASNAPAIYQAADAYLMMKYNDPCPNTVLEALASGLPVLYSASGGVPELVGADAGVGLALPVTFDQDLTPSAEAIAQGMQRVIVGAEPMAVAGRRRALERFTLRTWLARHEAVFHSVLRTGHIR